MSAKIALVLLAVVIVAVQASRIPRKDDQSHHGQGSDEQTGQVRHHFYREENHDGGNLLVGRKLKLQFGSDENHNSESIELTQARKTVFESSQENTGKGRYVHNEQRERTGH